MIIASSLNFPEAPLIDKEGSLWCTELLAGSITRITKNGKEKFKLGETANGMIEDADGNFIVTDSAQNVVRYFDRNMQKASVLFSQTSDGKALFRPNDLCFDKQDNLLVTCHAEGRTSPSGFLVVRTKSGQVKIISQQKFFPNGIAFDESGETLYFSETYKHRIWRAKWNSMKAEIVEETPWAEVGGPIGPDGMCLDTEGNIYVTVFDQSKIVVIAPNGKIMDTIQLPYKRPTSCAFDPLERYGMLITDAEKGLLFDLPVKAKGLEVFKGKLIL